MLQSGNQTISEGVRGKNWSPYENMVATDCVTTLNEPYSGSVGMLGT
jgi:hypothetical protein